MNHMVKFFIHSSCISFSDGMKLRGGKTKIEYPDSPSRDAKSKAVGRSFIHLFVLENNIPGTL